MFITAADEKKMKEDFIFNVEKSCLTLDEGMFPYLKELNSIPGIVTESSCRGHDDTYIGRGYLVCYITEQMFDLLTKKLLPNLIGKLHLTCQNPLHKCAQEMGLKINTDLGMWSRESFATNVEIKVDYQMDNIRLIFGWHRDNFDEFLPSFIQELKDEVL